MLTTPSRQLAITPPGSGATDDDTIPGQGHNRAWTVAPTIRAWVIAQRMPVARRAGQPPSPPRPAEPTAYPPDTTEHLLRVRGLLPAAHPDRATCRWPTGSRGATPAAGNATTTSSRSPRWRWRAPFSCYGAFVHIVDSAMRVMLASTGHPHLILRLSTIDPADSGRPHAPRLPADQIIERA
jgi:hypothetical protein